MSQTKRPKPPVVPLELWREIYQAAVGFQSLAPWQWMHDRHVLGIDDEHGVRLASVLGNLGEVFGLAIYQGSTGTNFLLRLLRGDSEPDDPETIFHNDAILVDFVPRAELAHEDIAIIKAIGFKPAALKPRLFPKFTSHKSGYLPWFIDEQELRCVLDTLRKVTGFAALIRDQPEEIDRHNKGEYPFFPAAMTAPLTWSQLVWHIVTPVEPPSDPAIEPPKSVLDALLKTPQNHKVAWEAGAFYTHMSIQQPPRPYWSKIGLAVDADSGYVLGFHAGGPDVTMAETAARCILDSIAKHGIRPGTIYVDSLKLAQPLAPLVAALKIKLVEMSSLPMLNEARASLENFSG